MTKFCLISDIHFGFSKKTPKLVECFLKSFPEFDVLLIAGDIASTRPNQINMFFKLLREIFPEKICCTVLGNHDRWRSTNPKKQQSFFTIEKYYEEVFLKFNIHYLENNAFELPDITVLGFDGWYGSQDPPSNDLVWMPRFTDSIPTHEFFYKRAQCAMEYILEYKTLKKKIIVTHFEYNGHAMGANMSWFNFLLEKADVICTGHSHQYRNLTWENGTRIYNCGADYDNPRFICFEL